jgi:hypothetical protein
MNTKSIEARVDPLDGAEQTDQGTNGPLVNTDSVLLGTVVEETSTGSDAVAFRPLEEVIVHEFPLEERVSSNAPEVDMVAHRDVIDTKAAVVPLLEHKESEHFRTLWNEIQGRFVDEPRSAVQQADALVSDVIEKITQMFASEHGALEGQWKEGRDVSTEDLRQALQHYRSFFNRLVV